MLQTQDYPLKTERARRITSPRNLSDRLYGILPAVSAIALVCTNRWFTEVDDEVAIIDKAAHPASKTIGLFLHGIGQHEHPPLYDLILHGWLRITNGNGHLLRVPSIIFYALGAWILASVAKRLDGEASRNWVLLILAVWPFGFHYARLATWYSFCFLLVSFLTLCYLRLIERPSLGNWLCVVAGALALVYANYYGWAFVACLAFDYLLQNRHELRYRIWPLIGTFGLLLLAYLPIFRAFIKEIRFGVGGRGFGIATLINGIFNLYCLFVSESVAPWFWFWGVLSGIAVAACLGIVLLRSADAARRFLFYFLALFLFLAIDAILEPKRLLLLSPWLVMPIAVTLGTMSRDRIRHMLVLSLALPAAVGWYGIFVRNLYAAPHWVEPWERIARQSRVLVDNGGIAIGNNPSYFFYLTYLSRAAGSPFAGLLPESVRVSGIYSAEQWLAANRPIAANVQFVNGVHYSISPQDSEATLEFLDGRCTLQTDERAVPDSGAHWKRRYAPQIDQPDWRIEVRTYACK